MDDADLLELGAVRLAAAIRTREVSCRETMAAHLARIAAANPAVNAIVSLRDPDELLAEADAADRALAAHGPAGPLHGLPQAPKDLADTRDLRTTYGSPVFRDHVPDADALVVARARGAGAIVIGKTNVPEWGLGSQTYNPVFGATGNAYDPTRTAGGSSGGAAVALALRMLPVADGSDMGGSLRNPAGWANIFGLRPSQGRVPSLPSEDVWFGQLGTEGPLARSVDDLALLLAVQAGYDPRAPLSLGDDPAALAPPVRPAAHGLRVAWLGDWGGHLATEPGVLATCEEALARLAALGCAVEPVPPPFPPDRLWECWLDLRAFAVGCALAPLADDPATGALLKPEAHFEVERARGLSAARVAAAAATRSAWHATLLELFARVDVVAVPTAQVHPFAVEETWPRAIGGREMDTYHRWMEVVVPWTLAGCPALSIPAGFSARGLPVGLQLVAAPRADAALLGLGKAYEEAAADVLARTPSMP